MFSDESNSTTEDFIIGELVSKTYVDGNLHEIYRVNDILYHFVNDELQFEQN